MGESTEELSGTRILIAEDEPLVALDHADRSIDAVASAPSLGPAGTR